MTPVEDLDLYRRRKARMRVFAALERLYLEVLTHLADDERRISPAEFEEFMVQVLGDHLVGDLDETMDLQRLDQNYRCFDARLRRCLQVKLMSLKHFERARRR